MTSPKRRLHKRRDPGICAEIGPIVRRVADGDGVTCDCCETLIPPGTPYRFATNWWVAGHSATCIRKAVYKAYAAFSGDLLHDYDTRATLPVVEAVS